MYSSKSKSLSYITDSGSNRVGIESEAVIFLILEK
jgi:hypothetical protein